MGTGLWAQVLSVRRTKLYLLVLVDPFLGSRTSPATPTRPGKRWSPGSRCLLGCHLIGDPVWDLRCGSSPVSSGEWGWGELGGHGSVAELGDTGDTCGRDTGLGLRSGAMEGSRGMLWGQGMIPGFVLGSWDDRKDHGKGQGGHCGVLEAGLSSRGALGGQWKGQHKTGSGTGPGGALRGPWGGQGLSPGFGLENCGVAGVTLMGKGHRAGSGAAGLLGTGMTLVGTQQWGPGGALWEWDWGQGEHCWGDRELLRVEAMRPWERDCCPRCLRDTGEFWNDLRLLDHHSRMSCPSSPGLNPTPPSPSWRDPTHVPLCAPSVPSLCPPLSLSVPRWSRWLLPALALLARTLALLAMTVATVATTVVPLDMARDSFDDQYRGCRQAMALAVPALCKFEYQKNPLFAQTWAKADAEWRTRGSPVSPLPSPWQAVALLTYTTKDIYKEFNEAVRTAGRSRREYRDRFHFKALHFLLSQALAALRDTQKNKCHRVSRGVHDVQFQARAGQRVRFGHFTSTSLG
ncbi:hypothetical protein DV515_00017411 [Chloebia gouldiae]|uniref:NAD(P)(+)--arginine ADP-ribosyltransferase n=1 Tax=Chloebia gouldiae TaxID=44316 RepID=A0A3L8QVN7_CHLGU|nr:hypothetical protein DV515_00017411 [Chloebia gouldiae]